MSQRSLVIVADDYGIGPETSRGILDLARMGIVRATVMLVNSPFAKEAVAHWRADGRPVELGWHPCLTIDAPVLPPELVPSLVGRDGKFHPLGRFMARTFARRVSPRQVEAELAAQYRKFAELTGMQPTVVNAHHHVQIFPAVGRALRKILAEQPVKPWLRRVREPLSLLRSVPGSLPKRLFLTSLGARQSRHQAGEGLPGADWLAGVTDPPCVAASEFFSRWLEHTPGPVAELTCHPGYEDVTLSGRDAFPGDGQMARRVRELELLRHPDFLRAVREHRWKIVSPGELSTAAARPQNKAA